MSIQKTLRTSKRSPKKTTRARPVESLRTQTSARQSRVAFLRAFPRLARQPELDRQWVLFFGERHVSSGRTKLELIQLCQRRRIEPGQYYIGFVDGSGSREEVEQIDSPNCP